MRNLGEALDFYVVTLAIASPALIRPNPECMKLADKLRHCVGAHELKLKGVRLKGLVIEVKLYDPHHGHDPDC